MRRREFIALLGSAAATEALTARAQTLTPANELGSLLQQAEGLGAPVAAVRRAIQISRQPIFPKKDALAVFDISQLFGERKDSTFLISNQARSPRTTRPMEEIMGPT